MLITARNPLVPNVVDNSGPQELADIFPFSDLVSPRMPRLALPRLKHALLLYLRLI